jgi:multicomponent Na+:H+ antiporter subunit B
MTPAVRRGLFLVGLAGFLAFYLWGLTRLPGFGRYPGPYGFIINRIAVSQTNATGVVSAVNFEYRGFDTVGEEFILFVAATGVATVLRQLRDESEGGRSQAEFGQAQSGQAQSGQAQSGTTDTIRLASLLFVGPAALFGWFLASHAQTSPSGGFQGGVVLATAFVLIYLAGQFLTFRRISPADLVDSVGAVGAAGFAAIGLTAVGLGFAYLYNFLPRGTVPGAVSSSGTIALISFFVGIEVAAAFILIVGELVEQTLLVRAGGADS